MRRTRRFPLTCALAAVTAVAASTAATAQLCEPTETVLRFDGGYEVSMCYETPAGEVGQAKAGIWASGQSGLLWFFSRDNAEVLVKVLDGCEHNGYRWVFVAPVTTLEFNLRVTGPNGQRWTHTNNQGRTATARSDTSAFRCASSPPPPTTGSVTGTWEGLEDTFVLPYGWQFKITDDNGRLSGSYGVDTFGGTDYTRRTGTVTGTRRNGRVSITLRPKTRGSDYEGSFVGSVDGDRMTGEIEYGNDAVDLGPYDLTLERVSTAAAAGEPQSASSTDAAELADRLKSLRPGRQP